MQMVDKEPDFSFRRGLGVFVACFLLSVFLGSVTKRVLSGPRLKSVIAQKLALGAPDVEFDLGESRIQLSRGVLPIVGLKLSDLTVRRVASCGKRLHLKFEELLVPFHFLELLNGRMRLGTMEALRLTVFEVPEILQRCDKGEFAKGESTPSSVVQSPSGFGGLPIQTPLSPLPADGVKVSEVTILSPRAEPFIRLRNLRVDVLSAGLGLETHVDLLRVSEVPVAPLRIRLSLTNKFDEGTLDLRWREGRASGELKSLKSKAIEAQLVLSKMPLAELYNTALRLGFVNDRREIGANWLDGRVRWSGQERKIELRDLVMSGDIGQVGVKGLDVHYLPSVQVDPFQIDLAPLRVKEVLRILKIDEIQRLFTDPGMVIGKIDHANGHFKLSGGLGSTVAIVTRGSRRGVWRFPSARIEAEHLPNRGVTGSLSKIEGEAGPIIGQIRWDHRFQGAQTQFKIDLDQVLIPEQMASQVWGYRFGPFGLNSNIQLNSGKLQTAEIGIRLKEARGDFVEFSDLSVKALFSEASGRGELQLKRAKVFESWEGHRVLSGGRQGPVEMMDIGGPLAFEGSEFQVGPLRFKGLLESGEFKGKLQSGNIEGDLLLQRVDSRRQLRVNGSLENPVLVQ